MNVFYEITSSIKNILESSDVFDSVKFINTLKSSSMPNPIKKVYVAFGISKVQVTEGAFSDYIGIKDDEELYGNLADIDIGVKIYSPFNIGSQSCYDTFSNICEVLLKSDNENLGIQSISSNAINYDVDTSNFVLECNVKVSTFIGYSKKKSI